MSMQIERFHTGPRMSKIVRHAGLVYLCGQTSSGRPDAQDIESQTREMLARADALLTEAGSSRERILAATIHLRDMGDFAAFNAVYGKYFTEKPARSCVAVKTLPKNVLVEVEVIAAL